MFRCLPSGTRAKTVRSCSLKFLALSVCLIARRDLRRKGSRYTCYSVSRYVPLYAVGPASVPRRCDLSPIGLVVVVQQSKNQCIRWLACAFSTPWVSLSSKSEARMVCKQSLGTLAIASTYCMYLSSDCTTIQSRIAPMSWNYVQCWM